MSEQSGQSILGVFFTYGVSVLTWKNQGMLAREVALYRALARDPFQKVYFFTYGVSDATFVRELSEQNIIVFPKKKNIPNFLYSFLMPFLYKKELRECSVYKTTQMFGSWAAVIAKLLYHKKLLVRTGFTLSIFARKKSVLRYWGAKVIEFFALRFADRCIVATAEEQKYFSHFQKKISVIPNFVDTHLFYPLQKVTHSRKETVLLFIGRLNAQKNLQNLFLALVGVPNIHLQIIGSGELQFELQRFAEEKCLSVEFLGNRPHTELPDHIHSADIFVLPSFYEGNPKTLLEAMACGAVVLATKVQGIENIIVHKENGYLSDTSSESLHQAVLELIKNIDLQKQMGEKAVQYIENTCSLEIILKKERDIYLPHSLDYEIL